MLLLLFAKAQAQQPQPQPATTGGDGETSLQKRIRPPFILNAPRLDLQPSIAARRRRNAAILFSVIR